MKLIYTVLLALVELLASSPGFCQESVFNGLKSNVKRADYFFNINSYKNAQELYLSAERKNKGGDMIYLKLGRTYFKLKEYENSAFWYGKHMDEKTSLPDAKLLNYAEALRSTGDYEKAIRYYKIYRKTHPEDQRIIEKIWRLSNIQFLLEDSIYYTVKLADINSEGAVYSPTFYKDGLVLVADKKAIGGITEVDGVSNTPFKTLYFAGLRIDTLAPILKYNYTELEEFSKEITSRYNIGPLSFFPGETKMIYTKNGELNRKDGSTLQLFIAKKSGNIWKEVEPMPFNSTKYSVSHPALNEDGNILYFVTDMPGGYGGKDLYVSYYRNNSWSKPENLGDRINTPGDETFPFVHKSNLYFASNGHSGLGGLDIYKIDSRDIHTGQVINPGFPLNTSFDDFGIALNDDGTRGFISSNRRNGGFDDNIYEIEIDLQTYPLTIRGIVRYKELNWRDLDMFDILPNANLFLIDVRRGIQVGKSKTDSLGYFEIDIPYASLYVMKVVESSIGEIKVSFEIPKNKKPDEGQDIVIVKDGSLLNKESNKVIRPLNSDSLKLNVGKNENKDI